MTSLVTRGFRRRGVYQSQAVRIYIVPTSLNDLLKVEGSPILNRMLRLLGELRLGSKLPNFHRRMGFTSPLMVSMISMFIYWQQ